jgi:hypothetical protein
MCILTLYSCSILLRASLSQQALMVIWQESSSLFSRCVFLQKYFSHACIRVHLPVWRDAYPALFCLGVVLEESFLAQAVQLAPLRPLGRVSNLQATSRGVCQTEYILPLACAFMQYTHTRSHNLDKLLHGLGLGGLPAHIHMHIHPYTHLENHLVKLVDGLGPGAVVHPGHSLEVIPEPVADLAEHLLGCLLVGLGEVGLNIQLSCTCL